MKLIVGLGNIGEKYQNSRHNLGFLALDNLLEKLEPLNKSFWDDLANPNAILKKQKTTFASIKKVKTDSEDLILAKPQTFMNNSGFAVSRLLSFYKTAPSGLIVIHDDSDLPLGKIRIRFGGAAGGHRGMQSIIDTIGTDKFLRIRLGIGRPFDEKKGKEKRKDLDRYVLASFLPQERNEVKHMLKESTQKIELILQHGLQEYMSKYNK